MRINNLLRPRKSFENFVLNNLASLTARLAMTDEPFSPGSCFTDSVAAAEYLN
jgi:hypothetical protein